MAQPQYAIQYLGTVLAKPNTVYTNTQLLADFPTATVVQLCTNTPGASVGISINSYPMCHFQDDSEQYLAATPVQTYEFAEECILRIGIYKAVV